MTALALAVLAERDGTHLPGGTCVAVQHVSQHVLEDRPVLDAVRRYLQRDIARAARAAGHPVATDDVTLAEVTADELAARIARDPLAPTPHPSDPVRLHTVVGYWTPPTADRPTEEPTP